MDFENAQTIMDERGMPVGCRIDLPYTLYLEVSGAENVCKFCHNEDEETALTGLLSVCQGVLLTVGGMGHFDLGAIIMIVNPLIGAIVSARDVGLTRVCKHINPNSSFEAIVEDAMSGSELVTAMLSKSGQSQLQYVEFEDLVPLWVQLFESGTIYSLRDYYIPTNYAMQSGLNDVALDIFNSI